MGYTFIHKENKMKLFDFFSKEFNGENKDFSFKVLACKTVNKIAYLAVEKIIKTTNERTVYAVACILSYAKDYYNFGYKDINESMHPYYYECPDKILNMLTYTENENALSWRQKCRENNQKIFKRPKLSIGDIIEFENNIKFRNGIVAKKFVIKTLKPFRLYLHGLVGHCDLTGYDYMTYKLTQKFLKENPHKVVK